MRLKNNQHHYDIIAKILNDEEKPQFLRQDEEQTSRFLKNYKMSIIKINNKYLKKKKKTDVVYCDKEHEWKYLDVSPNTHVIRTIKKGDTIEFKACIYNKKEIYQNETNKTLKEEYHRESIKLDMKTKKIKSGGWYDWVVTKITPFDTMKIMPLYSPLHYELDEEETADRIEEFVGNRSRDLTFFRHPNIERVNKTKYQPIRSSIKLINNKFKGVLKYFKNTLISAKKEFEANPISTSVKFFGVATIITLTILVDVFYNLVIDAIKYILSLIP